MQSFIVSAFIGNTRVPQGGRATESKAIAISSAIVITYQYDYNNQLD